MPSIYLKPFEASDEPFLLGAIADFWQHHHQTPSQAEIKADIKAWSADGHQLFIITEDTQPLGFIHMGERGGKASDWLEDIYVLPSHRGRGIASQAIAQIEKILQAQGLPSLYLEVVPRNENALRLYHQLGFNVLNTLTLRKDFIDYGTLKTETISGLAFRTTFPEPLSDADDDTDSKL